MANTRYSVPGSKPLECFGEAHAAARTIADRRRQSVDVTAEEKVTVPYGMSYRTKLSTRVACTVRPTAQVVKR